MCAIVSSGEELKYSRELFVSFRWQHHFLRLYSSFILDDFFHRRPWKRQGWGTCFAAGETVMSHGHLHAYWILTGSGRRVNHWSQSRTERVFLFGWDFFFMFSFGFLGGCVLIFFLNSVYAHHTVLPLNKAFWRRCDIRILCTKHLNALKLCGGFDPRHSGMVTALNPLEVGPCRQRGFQSVNKRT